MKRYFIFMAVLLMACTPAFAQFPQVAGDPINYSLIRYPHYPGSYPVLMSVDLLIGDVFDDNGVRVDAFTKGIKGDNEITLYYDGELIKTKDISDKMLRNAINWGFQESGIRDRKHFQQLIDKLDVVVPRKAESTFWEDNINFAAGEITGKIDEGLFTETFSGGELVKEEHHTGRFALAAKWLYKSAKILTGKSTIKKEFASLDFAQDATNVILTEVVKVGSEFTGVSNMLFFTATFWKGFYDEMYAAYYTNPPIAAAISAAQMICKFYEATNAYLRDSAELLEEEKWMIYINGEASHSFIFNDEECSFSLRMKGTLDKLWPIDDDRPDATDRFYKTFEGRYFGWLEAKQFCDMSNFDKNYIIMPDSYFTENSAAEKGAAIAVPNSPMGVRQYANFWCNEDRKKPINFTHSTKVGTAASATYQIPIVLRLEHPYYYRKYANTAFHTPDGTEEVAGEYPKPEVENLKQTYHHEFSYSMDNIKMKYEEKIVGNKMQKVVNGMVDEETDAGSCLMTPPQGYITVNMQQSIADGTFSSTK